jgi:hypothetical protein
MRAMQTKKKNGHGGARKGAGRPCKDGPKERVSASVKIGTANALKDEALARGISISRLIARKLEAAQPYDPHLPDMPPLIDDVILPSPFNPEAEEIRRYLANQAKAARKAAKESGEGQ